MRTLLCVILCLTLSGCGGPSAEVTGKLTWKDQPVSQADVKFVGVEDSEHQVFTGFTDKEGAYRLDKGAQSKIPPGKYNVTVTFALQRNGKPLPEGELGDRLRNEGRVVQFEAVVQQEINEGDNVINLDVTKSAKRVAIVNDE